MKMSCWYATYRLQGVELRFYIERSSVIKTWFNFLVNFSLKDVQLSVWIEVGKRDSVLKFQIKALRNKSPQKLFFH